MLLCSPRMENYYKMGFLLPRCEKSQAQPAESNIQDTNFLTFQHPLEQHALNNSSTCSCSTSSRSSPTPKYRSRRCNRRRQASPGYSSTRCILSNCFCCTSQQSGQLCCRSYIDQSSNSQAKSSGSREKGWKLLSSANWRGTCP